MDLLAPSVDALVANLMPWLFVDEGRSRSLSRSGAVRRPRSPSLSTFWQENSLLYFFLQSNFSRFTSIMRDRPAISLTSLNSEVLEEGNYSINCRGLRRWDGSVWSTLFDFEPLDLLISFPLRDASLYFKVIPFVV